MQIMFQFQKWFFADLLVFDVSKILLYVSYVQAKVARLAKKFGEANQATENKKKQEVRNRFSALLLPVISEDLCKVIFEKSYPITHCLSPQAAAAAMVPKTATVPVTTQVQR